MKKLGLLLALCVVQIISWGQSYNYWIKKADFTGLKRERAVAFTVGDYAYVGTGVDTAEQVHDDFWKYDPMLDSWTQVATMPGAARRNAIAFAVGDKGYVGTGFSHAESMFGVELADFWEYNPTTNQWVQKANYPATAVYFATGFAIEDKGYICGGKRGPNNYTSALYEYNPATDSWASKANFPGGVRYQLSSFVIENSGYVGLGTDQDMYRNDIWEYKPSQNQWTQKADLPASERAASHTFSIGFRGFVCMGTNGGYLDDLWEYNPYDNSWSVRATYGGSKRKGGVAFTLLGRGYVGIGKGNSGKKASFWQYVPGAWVGVKELPNLSYIVYPNPAQDVVNVGNASMEIDKIQIVDLTGRIHVESEGLSSINVSALAPGSYLLIASNSNEGAQSSQPLIIQ